MAQLPGSGTDGVMPGRPGLDSAVRTVPGGSAGMLSKEAQTSDARLPSKKGYEILAQSVVRYDLSCASSVGTLYVWRTKRLRKKPRFFQLKRVPPR